MCSFEYHLKISYARNGPNVVGIAKVAERSEAILTKYSEVGNLMLGDVAATSFDMLPTLP